jgi:hypothetical protein
MLASNYFWRGAGNITFSINVLTCVYMCLHMYIYTYIYIKRYSERRTRERERVEGEGEEEARKAHSMMFLSPELA